jgi:hypothetical protein
LLDRLVVIGVLAAHDRVLHARRLELLHPHSATGIAHGCGHETLSVHVDFDTDLRHLRLGEVLRGVPLSAVVIELRVQNAWSSLP